MAGKKKTDRKLILYVVLLIALLALVGVTSAPIIESKVSPQPTDSAVGRVSIGIIPTTTTQTNIITANTGG